MKYYRMDDGEEYYAVVGIDEPFYWFCSEGWKNTLTDHFDVGQTWAEWLDQFADLSSVFTEICRLEVMLICGSLPEYE